MTNDPPEAGIPFCTLKSFPSKIEHTIQWARDKFQTMFTLKPRETIQFATDSKSNGFWERLKAKNLSKPDLSRAIKLLKIRPTTFNECLQLGLNKFTSLFRNSILQLTYIYPPDYVKDGHLFWSPPRRLPKSIEFDVTNSVHIDFVINTALLFANVYQIKDIEKDRAVITRILSGIKIPPFEIKKDKYIEADETATQEQAKARQQKENFSPGEFDTMLAELIELTKSVPTMVPEEFEKDVDENHHIDFITAGSNIRAIQYGIEYADRLKTKKIAGKIIPAMATTTAAVSGLVSIELIKVILGLQNLSVYKNAWLNLALPIVMLSEPQSCPVTKIKDDLQISLWTKRWEVKKGNLTLGQLFYHFKKEYGLDVSGVFYGVNMVYGDIFKEHKQRLPKRMTKLLDVPDTTPFVDLDCIFSRVDTKAEVTGPKVRVFLQQQKDE
jgi:ubiquitin-activating enzyme E1-like protein 2